MLCIDVMPCSVDVATNRPSVFPWRWRWPVLRRRRLHPWLVVAAVWLWLPNQHAFGAYRDVLHGKKPNPTQPTSALQGQKVPNQTSQNHPPIDERIPSTAKLTLKNYRAGKISRARAATEIERLLSDLGVSVFSTGFTPEKWTSMLLSKRTLTGQVLKSASGAGKELIQILIDDKNAFQASHISRQKHTHKPVQKNEESTIIIRGKFKRLAEAREFSKTFLLAATDDERLAALKQIFHRLLRRGATRVTERFVKAPNSTIDDLVSSEAVDEHGKALLLRIADDLAKRPISPNAKMTRKKKAPVKRKTKPILAAEQLAQVFFDATDEIVRSDIVSRVMKKLVPKDWQTAAQDFLSKPVVTVETLSSEKVIGEHAKNLLLLIAIDMQERPLHTPPRL